MATVLALRTAGGREYSVAGMLRIGRATENEICLTGDDLVSRLHARVWLDGERVFVRDEGSSNGTRVNGQALAAGEVYRLRPGDNVRIGATIFTVTARPSVRAVTGPLPAAGVAVPPIVQPLVVQPVAVPPPSPAPVAPPAPLAAPPAPPATGASMPAATRIDQGPFAAQAPAASHRGRNLLLGGCLVLIVLAVCGGLAVLGLTAGRPAIATALAQVGGGVPGAPTPAPAITLTPPPGPGTAIAAAATPAVTAGADAAQIVSTSPALTPLAPAVYAATSHNLAADVAALNTAQLVFIRDAKTGHPSAGLDEDLRTVAASAFKVGLDGETLSWATAAQDGASDTAGKMGSLYARLACAGFAQAIDAQNLRGSLAGGQPDLAAAAAVVADYGARAWNPTVTDPAVKGNPFLPHLAASDMVPVPAPVPAAGVAAISSAIGVAAGPLIWLDAPAATLTRTISLPVGAPLADPRDPALLAALITPAGQADAVKAQQAAEAGLLRLGAALQRPAGRHSSGVLAALRPPTAKDNQDTLQTNVFVALLTSDTPAADAFLAFGNSIALAEKAGPASSGGDANIVNTLFGLDQNNQPSKQGQIPVTAAAPAVSMTISNIHVDSVSPRNPGGTFAAEASVSYDISWQTNIVRPQFIMHCGEGQFVVTQSSGSRRFTSNVLLILYPGNADLYCFAGVSLGSGTASVLVGDPAGATQEAAKVETDSAAFDITLTAAAGATSTAQALGATQTAAVLSTQNALETEQAASQTAEFRATITEIAHLTAVAVPVASDTPSPTPTFVPVLLETLEHPGTQFAVSTKTVLQPNRLYQFCFSGTVNLINPTKAATANDIDHVNGVKVPASGCMVVEGNGKTAVISCGSGEVDTNDPGGFTIQVVDLGPG